MKKCSSKKAISPKLIREAAAMREAGFTLAAIARDTGISSRTLSRRFAAMNVLKGASMARLIERSRERLLDRLTDDEELEREVKAALLDDLALSRAMREKIAHVIETLAADSHEEAAESARALTAVSTAMKTSQEVIHRAIGKERFARQQEEDLPTLHVKEMTAADIEAVRDQQRAAREDPYLC